MICRSCGAEAPTRKATFHENIGFAIVHVSRTVRGELCRSCVRAHFRRCTLVTLIFGWWGPVSLFLAPCFLAHNLLELFRCRSLAPAAPGVEPAPLTAGVIDRMLPHARRVIDGLNRGEDPERIARDVAARASVSPGQVVLFMSGQAAGSADAG